MDEDCLPSNHPHLSKDLKQIAIVYMQNDQHDEAIRFCQTKLDFQENMPNADQTRVAQTLMTMAMVHTKKQLELAVDFYQKALSTIRQSKPIDDPLLAKCLTALGGLRAIQKQFESALKYLHKALSIYRRCVSPEHVNIADVCKTVAMCYLKLDDSSEALRYFNESLVIYRRNYASDHERVKYVEEKIAALTSEHNTEEICESNVTHEPIPATVHDEAVKENNNDEQIITVIIDPESSPSLDEQTKCTPREIKRKRKTMCPRCSIS